MKGIDKVSLFKIANAKKRNFRKAYKVSYAVQLGIFLKEVYKLKRLIEERVIKACKSLRFNLMEFSLSAKFNNQKISVIISLILEILIASSIDFYNYESILRFINPGFYAFSLGFCTNAYLELLMCGIYHLIIISILVLINLKIIKNCNINIGFRK